QLLLAPAAWLPCALDRRWASASVSSKAIIAILSKTRPIARMVLPIAIQQQAEAPKKGFCPAGAYLTAPEAYQKFMRDKALQTNKNRQAKTAPANIYKPRRQRSHHANSRQPTHAADLSSRKSPNNNITSKTSEKFPRRSQITARK